VGILLPARGPKASGKPQWPRGMIERASFESLWQSAVKQLAPRLMPMTIFMLRSRHSRAAAYCGGAARRVVSMGSPPRREYHVEVGKIVVGALAALLVAGTAGWFSLDKEGGLLAFPTNRDLLFWSVRSAWPSGLWIACPCWPSGVTCQQGAPRRCRGRR
jgi:hypothetical protein